MFASDFPHEIAMEDALHEINEILERKDINDKPSRKSRISGVMPAKPGAGAPPNLLGVVNLLVPGYLNNSLTNAGIPSGGAAFAMSWLESAEFIQTCPRRDQRHLYYTYSDKRGSCVRFCKPN